MYFGEGLKAFLSLSFPPLQLWNCHSKTFPRILKPFPLFLCGITFPTILKPFLQLNKTFPAFLKPFLHFKNLSCPSKHFLYFPKLQVATFGLLVGMYPALLKFLVSKKATKFETISYLIWRLLSKLGFSFGS